MTDFGTLRSLLQQAPSQRVWSQLCRQARRWAEAAPQAFEQQGLPYLRGHLSRWPRALCVLPEAWAEEVLADETPQHAALGMMRVLSFRDRDVLEEQVESIAYCRWFDFAEVLDFSRSRRSVWRRDNLYNQGISELAQSPHLKQLKVFRAAGHHIRPEGLRLVGTRAVFEALELLDLSHNNFGFLRQVGHEPWSLIKLQELYLRDTELSWPGLDYLLQTGVFTELRGLDISHNELFVQGIEQLVRDAHFQKLEQLNLAHTQLADAGVHALLESQGFSSLKSLDLSGNELSASIGRALARAESIQHIERLILNDNALSDEGVSSLLAPNHLSRLKVLEITHNQIGRLGLRALAQWPGLAAQRHLNLSHNRIDDEAIIALLESPYLTELEHLVLSHNQISDEGARRLSHSERLPALHTLDVEDNLITDRGFRPFVTRQRHGSLRRLKANGNPVDEELMRDILAHDVPFDFEMTLNTMGYGGDEDEGYDEIWE